MIINNLTLKFGIETIEANLLSLRGILFIQLFHKLSFIVLYSRTM